MTKKVKASINEYGTFHKILTESFKYPMKWKTVMTFKEYVDSCEEIAKKKAEEINLEKRIQENSVLFNKELERITQLEQMKKENKKLNPEELSKKVLEISKDTAPAKEEKRIFEEYIYSEVEFPIMNYIVDENLPGQLNVYLSACPFVNFKVK